MDGFAPEQLFCARVPLQTELASDERVNSNARRVAAKPALHPLVTGHFAGLTTDEVIARLEGARIANAHVNTMQDMWAHPQLKPAAGGSTWPRQRARAGAASARHARRLRRPDGRGGRAWATHWPTAGGTGLHAGRDRPHEGRGRGVKPVRRAAFSRPRRKARARPWRPTDGRSGRGWRPALATPRAVSAPAA